jgi:ferredoxin-type protein NapH
MKINLRASRLRTISVLLFLAVTVLGLGFKSGTGSLCAFGYKTISAICPLGAIEASVASKTFLPWAMISLAFFIAFAILLGRTYCAWICPVPTVRSCLAGSAKKSGPPAADQLPKIREGLPRSERHPDGKPSKIRLDSRHYILGGALLSTAILGFPVFCLICPIGLITATIIGIWRLFQFNEPSWTLLIFPGILILELVVCRKWCRKICPLGALLSLFASLNVFVRPKINPNTCIRISKGMDCTLCKSACPESIDLHHAKESQPLSECTKCRECSDACQAGAITFPLCANKPPQQA